MSNSTNLLVSEGTCYFGAGQLAAANFIPCGNANVEVQTCCQKGSYCLSSSTCWDPSTAVTYIAGCSDKTFLASSCAQRFDWPDQQWVALARGDGDDITKWSGCAQHPDLIELEKENCVYNASRLLINNPNGKDSFDEIGLLPNTTGGVIQFNPTAVPTAPSSNGGGGLSTGAKAGIGVGVGIGGLLIILGAVVLFLKMRRQKQTPQTDSEKRFDELDGSGVQRFESGGTERMELPDDDDSRVKSAELSPESAIVEMDNSNKYNGELAGRAAARGNGWWRWGRRD